MTCSVPELVYPWRLVPEKQIVQILNSSKVKDAAPVQDKWSLAWFWLQISLSLSTSRWKPSTRPVKSACLLSFEFKVLLLLLTCNEFCLSFPWFETLNAIKSLTLEPTWTRSKLFFPPKELFKKFVSHYKLTTVFFFVFDFKIAPRLPVGSIWSSFSLYIIFIYLLHPPPSGRKELPCRERWEKQFSWSFLHYLWIRAQTHQEFDEREMR